MVRPAGPTEVLEILLNSTEVQTQRDVEMKSPPRLLGFRFDDDTSGIQHEIENDGLKTHFVQRTPK